LLIRFISLLYRFAKIGQTECTPDIGFVVALSSDDAYRFAREQRRMSTSKYEKSFALKLAAFMLQVILENFQSGVSHRDSDYKLA